MIPDDSYKKLQARLRRLVELNDLSGERTKVKKQLEKQFMGAWQLAPDRLRLGCKLSDAIRLFRTKNDTCVRGFDHCSYYTGQNDQRVIVTQPYDSTPAEIQQDLTFGAGLHPEVIDATGWGFYYPGKSNMFVVKFPRDFIKAMETFKKQMRREFIDQSLERVHAGADESGFEN
jgi:hypothetical protein